MKLYAMITRKKWKDAVDLYFLLRHQEISLDRALEIAETKYYIKIFNQLAILEQLISMDWDMTEAVTYLIDSPPSDSEISEYLRNEGLRIMSQKSKTL